MKEGEQEVGEGQQQVDSAPNTCDGLCHTQRNSDTENALDQMGGRRGTHRLGKVACRQVCRLCTYCYLIDNTEMEPL